MYLYLFFLLSHLPVLLEVFSSITTYPTHSFLAFRPSKQVQGWLKEGVWSRWLVPWKGCGSTLDKRGMRALCWSISCVSCQRSSWATQSLFSSGQPCVHLAPKVRTNINKQLQNGEIKTSNVDRQDLDFLGAQFQIGLQCKWARSLTGQWFGNMKQEQ